MNSITRIIIRGLVSGEIKPEPEVFEYLKECNARHSRRPVHILRPRRTDTESPRMSPTRGSATDEVGSTKQASSDDDARQCRWATFVSASPSRWMRRVMCVLMAGALISPLGLAAQAAPQADHAVDHSLIQQVTSETVSGFWQMANVAGITGGVIHPFPQVLLVLTGILLLAMAVKAGWSSVCRSWLFVMRPYERALQELEAIQFRIKKGIIANPQTAMMATLRNYLEAQFGLPVEGSNSKAIECALRSCNLPIKPWQRILLDRLLESSRGGHLLGASSCINLNEQAACFVWATACNKRSKPVARGKI